MSNAPEDKEPTEEELAKMAEEEESLRDLLKRTAELPPPPPKTDVLRGVQSRIRRRSKGKFYADGWSTQEAPKGTYLVTAAVMLVLVFVLYFALAPGGIGRP